jgi:hypothetical protein
VYNKGIVYFVVVDTDGSQTFLDRSAADQAFNVVVDKGEKILVKCEVIRKKVQVVTETEVK